MDKTLILSKIKNNYKFKNDAVFARFLGITPQTLSNWYARNTIDYEIISTKCVDIDANWLLTGQGEMLRPSIIAFADAVSNIKPAFGDAMPSVGAVADAFGGRAQKNLIPLYETQSIGGTNGYSADLDPISQPSEWIDAGDLFSKATAAIHHYGDSMTEYPSGCILILRDISDNQLIIWGKNYVIETDEYRITKRLQRGDTPDVIKAYSTNIETYPDGTLIHEPVDIPRTVIRRVALVLGYVVKEHSSGKIYKVK